LSTLKTIRGIALIPLMILAGLAFTLLYLLWCILPWVLGACAVAGFIWLTITHDDLVNAVFIGGFSLLLVGGLIVAAICQIAIWLKSKKKVVLEDRVDIGTAFIDELNR
jgi:hypothetical protein